MKIAIVVHGRFHAFGLVRGLLQRGHDVTVFTNYPKWAVKRFGIAGSHVCSFWLHGVLARFCWFLHHRMGLHYPEAWLHSLFGRWASSELEKQTWHVLHCFSGIAEEIFQSPTLSTCRKLLVRASSHIITQSRLLLEEERRTGVTLDRPSDWMIAREQREYVLTDKVVVLSRFSYDSFASEGMDPDKVRILIPGVEHLKFRPTPETVEARCERILSGKPLRVLYVGALSFRKGMWDVAVIVRSVQRDKFQFRFVGPVLSEASKLLKELHGLGEFFSKRPQNELPKWHAWGDVFLFPTIEDGFPQALAQAHAGALPSLTTPNGCGTDLVRQDKTGWVLPVRRPEAFVERLLWCDTHRQELAQMVRRLYCDFRPRDWDAAAADFESICNEGWVVDKWKIAT
jgi:glycosyltransferase involved in cell wall biosynthesis